MTAGLTSTLMAWFALTSLSRRAHPRWKVTTFDLWLFGIEARVKDSLIVPDKRKQTFAVKKSADNRYIAIPRQVYMKKCLFQGVKVMANVTWYRYH